MTQLSDKFEEYLSSLSADEWTALEGRVRATKPPPPASSGDQQPAPSGVKSKLGLEEARRRGYVNEGKKRN